MWENSERIIICPNGYASRVIELPNGTLLGGYETRNGIFTSISRDGGKSWENESKASFRDEFSCANVNFFYNCGLVYHSYRAIGKTERGYYTSLNMSVSSDMGKSWSKHSLICEHYEPGGEFRGTWEPYVDLLNGKVVCMYANDSLDVTPQQNIESLTWSDINHEWGEKKIISNGVSHNSRDGMPVYIPLAGGGYACVIESSHMRDMEGGHPFVIRILYSKDGENWSEPVTVYIPKNDNSKAGAPGIIQTKSGRLVVSFQTDEDATVKGGRTSVMKTIISKKPVDIDNISSLGCDSFAESEDIFDTSDGDSAVWGGMYYSYPKLYASAGTKYGAEMRMCIVE